MELTDKQKRFCQEYIIDLNATQAAIRAGYQKTSAKSTASHLLAVPEVALQVQTLQGAIAQRLEISSDKIVQELAKLAFADIRDYIGPKGEIKDLSNLASDKTVAIENLRVTKTEWQGGAKTSTHLKLYSKQKALEKLGAHLGIFANEGKNPQNEKPIIIAPRGKRIQRILDMQSKSNENEPA